MRYKDAEEFKTTNGYTIDDVWYPRVTRILEIKAKPALDNFFREMGSYASAETVKNRSAEEGTLVHQTIEKIVRGGAVTIPEAIAPAVEAFQEFNRHNQITFHPDYLERQVWSGRHRYAGTVDALASVGGKFGVLDIKTSSGFYPEYNLQTAAYVTALQEFPIKRSLGLPHDIETRWILRINQHRICKACNSVMREKGGRTTIKDGRKKIGAPCSETEHPWGEREGDIELREFPYTYRDTKAFLAAKLLWEWENNYWLRKIGYAE